MYSSRFGVQIELGLQQTVQYNVHCNNCTYLLKHGQYPQPRCSTCVGTHHLSLHRSQLYLSLPESDYGKFVRKHSSRFKTSFRLENIT